MRRRRQGAVMLAVQGARLRALGVCVSVHGCLLCLSDAAYTGRIGVLRGKGQQGGMQE